MSTEEGYLLHWITVFRYRQGSSGFGLLGAVGKSLPDTSKVSADY